MDECGRAPIPCGTRYSPLINIEGMEGAWSTDFICTELIKGQMTVDIRFLFENAPKELLVMGVEFKLYEGSRM